MRRHLVLLLVLLAVLGRSPAAETTATTVAEDATATTAPAEDPIAGRTFEAVSLESDTDTLVEGVTLRIAFTDDEITVDAGCNRLSGTYAVDGPILVVADLGGTEMGCEPELMEQDAWISSVLTARPVITPQPPDGLVLSDDEVDADAGRGRRRGHRGRRAGRADVDPRHAHRRRGRQLGPRRASPPRSPSPPTAPTQCPPGATPAAGPTPRTGHDLTIEPPTLTRRRCDEAAMDVEAAVVAVLDGEVDAGDRGQPAHPHRADGAGLSLASS